MDQKGLVQSKVWSQELIELEHSFDEITHKVQCHNGNSIVRLLTVCFSLEIHLRL